MLALEGIQFLLVEDGHLVLICSLYAVFFRFWVLLVAVLSHGLWNSFEIFFVAVVGVEIVWVECMTGLSKLPKQLMF